MELNVLIGMNICEQRKKSGMKQRQVSKALQLSRTSIINIEAGRQMATTDTLLKLSVLFNCSIDSFFPSKEVYKPKFRL
jgi:transcriptional regulator with XRE-family HTH domain